MSKYQKSKKARRPNIPLASSPVAMGGGAETLSETLARPRSEPTAINFDYSHIQHDLTRIFTLAGIFIVVLVGLSFVIK
jgi:hypothetical protein